MICRKRWDPSRERSCLVDGKLLLLCLSSHASLLHGLERECNTCSRVPKIETNVRYFMRELILADKTRRRAHVIQYTRRDRNFPNFWNEYALADFLGQNLITVILIGDFSESPVPVQGCSCRRLPLLKLLLFFLPPLSSCLDIFGVDSCGVSCGRKGLTTEGGMYQSCCLLRIHSPKEP